MRRILILALALLASCTCKQAAEDKVFEAVSGGKIERDGKRITMTGENGEKITTQVDDEGGSVTAVIDGKDGTAVVGMGKLPENFPLPLFKDAQISMAMSGTRNETRTYTLTASVPAAPDVVGAFYEKALKDKGLTVKKTSQDLGGTMMVALQATGADKKTEVSVNVTSAEEGQSMLTVAWKEPE